MKQPGIDPRSWLSLARIDEGEDARVWDAELGWLVDVTFRGGALDGEGPVLCRVAGTTGPEFGAFFPPRADALVVVAVPGGDPNNDCVVLGELNDTETVPPSEVNGTTIDEAFAMQTQILVFPEQDVDAAYRNFRLTAERMVFGVADADQPFARGTDLADAMEALADAVETAFSDMSSLPPTPPMAGGGVPVAGLTPIVQALSAAVQQFAQARDTYLSTRIVGD